MEEKWCYCNPAERLADIPTHMPKNPWISIGAIGCHMTDTNMRVYFDDDTYLDIPFGIESEARSEA